MEAIATTRILLVEDDTDIADMLRLFFTMHDFDFHHAANGEEAIIQASNVLPHVILMDITLPDTDGYVLTVRLRWRPRTAHIPIIFLSQWSARDRRLTALELGGDDYLTKPFDLNELLLRTQNSLARAARDRFTDLRNGLPAAFVARDWIAQARADPQQAIIEIALEHARPFREAYGSAARADVQRSIGALLLATVNDLGDPDDFIGYLDEDNFVILAARSQARAIAEQIVARFRVSVGRYYSNEDRVRGAMRADEARHPLMGVRCRITAGDERVDVP